MSPATSNRRPDIEEYLTKRGIQFEFVSQLSPGRFDRDASLHNQARLGTPLSKETVERYASAIENGDVFPPLLAHEKKGKLVVLDGNHRLAAHADVGVPVDAYICTASAQTLMMVTLEANTKHGLPSSVEDRIHHALYLMDNGLSEKEAATRMNVARKDLRRANQHQSANRRADDAGILRSHWEAIPATSRWRLAMISTDEGFKAAAELAREAAMTAEEISQTVSHLNETKSSTRQVAMVKAVREGMSERIADVVLGGGARAGKRVGGVQSRIAMAIGQLVGLPEPEVIADQIPEQVRGDVVKKLDEATERIAAIKKALS